MHVSRASLFKETGWIHDEYDFEDLYDFNLCVGFEYNGGLYVISCEDDHCIYNADTGDVLYTFNSKEEFYNLVIFGKPIKEVIDRSHISLLW